MISGTIFPFKGMIGSYFGKFSRMYNVVHSLGPNNWTTFPLQNIGSIGVHACLRLYCGVQDLSSGRRTQTCSGLHLRTVQLLWKTWRVWDGDISPIWKCLFNINFQYDLINLYGHNIIGTEGAEWKRHRDVARSAFNEVRVFFHNRIITGLKSLGQHHCCLGRGNSRHEWMVWCWPRWQKIWRGDQPPTSFHEHRPVGHIVSWIWQAYQLDFHFECPRIGFSSFDELFQGPQEHC